MTTFAVTVTYGNRFHLLKQVCESAFAEGISKYAKGDLDEQITIRKILTDGQLASVWMVYQFVFQRKSVALWSEKFSAC